MKKNGFFALINRMKHISRWSLMRNNVPENIEGHSYQTAVLAHALCLIANRRCGDSLDPQRACVLALYHDAPEIITGDLPTPVKYRNTSIQKVYGDIEREAGSLLVDMLPDYLADEYSFIISGENEPEWKYVKAADTLSAYIKCLDEIRMGNKEFETAGKTIRSKLDSNPLPALKIFISDFLEAYGSTLDDLK